jgi:hypothetical protein
MLFFSTTLAGTNACEVFLVPFKNLVDWMVKERPSIEVTKQQYDCEH